MRQSTYRRPAKLVTVASVIAILAAGFWSLILLLVFPRPVGAVALVMASAIIQLASPWEPLPRAAARPMRLRYV